MIAYTAETSISKKRDKKRIKQDYFFSASSIIFSATMSPSIAEDVIPPAYPAPSPLG